MLALGDVVGAGELNATSLVGSALADRALLVLGGVVNSLVLLNCVLVRVVVFGGLVTGVNGMRVPATGELAAGAVAALELGGFSPGTVTGASVALSGNRLRPELPEAATGAGEVADSPAALPQAASSRTVMP